ncbi:MAG: hypothetical protein AAFY71_02580 [Bacteroidota bacterium]
MNIKDVFIPLVLITTLVSLTACQEEFATQFPFEQAQDSTHFNTQNWVTLSPQGVKREGVQIYPFSYNILGNSFSGYLLSSGSRVYRVREEGRIANRKLLVDFQAIPGDTLYSDGSGRYSLLLDRRYDPHSESEVFYVLQKNNYGRRARQRIVWIISPEHGILGAATYNINFQNGEIIPDMVGNPDYFRGEDFLNKIRVYDYNKATIADLARKVIYEFDKQKGILSSRSYRETESLAQYNFDPTLTRNWLNFQIEQFGMGIRLKAGAICYYFNKELELKREENCN